LQQEEMIHGQNF
jgi:hypothetical protein